MKVAWRGLTEMQGKLDRMASGTGLARVGARIGPILLDRYIVQRRWKNVTGALEASAAVDVKVSNGVIVVTLYVGEFYGWYLEHGTVNFGTRYSSIMPVIYRMLPEALAEASAVILEG